MLIIPNIAQKSKQINLSFVAMLHKNAALHFTKRAKEYGSMCSRDLIVFSLLSNVSSLNAPQIESRKDDVNQCD